MRHSPTSGKLIFVLLALYGAAAASTAHAAAPVPFYKWHVIAIEKIGDGSVVIRTKGGPEVVYDWYRANLKDGNGDTKTKDGAHILYRHSGATVDIETGNPFAPGTSIGIVWDAKKYGVYAAETHPRQSSSKGPSR
jgi:hypothetical protein